METGKFLIVLGNMGIATMTKLRVIEKRNTDPGPPETDFYLHVYVTDRAAFLYKVNGLDDELEHLKQTTHDPAPMDEAGSEPMEILVDEDGTKHLYCNLVGGPIFIEIDSERELKLLRQTITSATPYLQDRGVAES